jgi:hypothetical protein
MIIECDRCTAFPAACGDCVVGVLLQGPDAPQEEQAGHDDERWLPSGAPFLSLDAPERRALEVLAEQGFAPRLRLVTTRTRQSPPDDHVAASDRDAG